jgi:AcrR family transcriptional regulator
VLIRAGLAVITWGGPRALTLRAVGRRARVSRTAPYHHFTDKRGLLAAIAEEGFRALAEEMRGAAADHGGDPLSRLQALGQAYVAFARAHPAHFRVMFGPDVGDDAAHSALQAATAEAFGLLPKAVIDCQRAGLVFGGDPVTLAGRLWAAAHGVAWLLLDGKLRGRGGEDPEAVATGMMATMYLGLAPRDVLPGARSSADRPASAERDYDT